jgi:hypothetical protein
MDFLILSSYVSELFTRLSHFQHPGSRLGRQQVADSAETPEGDQPHGLNKMGLRAGQSHLNFSALFHRAAGVNALRFRAVRAGEHGTSQPSSWNSKALAHCAQDIWTVQCPDSHDGIYCQTKCKKYQCFWLPVTVLTAPESRRSPRN